MDHHRGGVIRAWECDHGQANPESVETRHMRIVFERIEEHACPPFGLQMLVVSKLARESDPFLVNSVLRCLPLQVDFRLFRKAEQPQFGPRCALHDCRPQVERCRAKFLEVLRV